MKQGKELWDKLARECPKHFTNSDLPKRVGEEEYRESGRQDFLRLIANDKLIKDDFQNMTVLDLGCGIGRMVEFMARNYKKVIGIDISGEMIIRAKIRLVYFNNISLHETDGDSIPYEDNCIDIVFSYLVFQHMKTKKEVEKNFKEVYRVLKPGGLFKVRLRTNKEPDMTAWWAGIHYTEKQAIIMSHNCGFYVKKTEAVKDYGLWLWLKKYE